MQKLIDNQNKTGKAVINIIVDKSVEEIKDRYYSVAKAILEHRGEHEHVIVQQPFDFYKEQKRKSNLAKLFIRTKEDNEEEKTLCADLKKLDQLIKKTEKEERQLDKLVRNEMQRQEAFKEQ